MLSVFVTGPPTPQVRQTTTTGDKEHNPAHKTGEETETHKRKNREKTAVCSLDFGFTPSFRLSELCSSLGVYCVGCGAFKTTGLRLHLDADLTSFRKENTLTDSSLETPCMPQGIHPKAPEDIHEDEA